MDQIICSLFNITVEAYTKADNNHGCCIDGNKFHQRCLCKDSLANCKVLCDADNNCKGYVKTKLPMSCEIATTSSCPAHCTTTDAGQFGKLKPAGTCGDTSLYFGCFIKGMNFISFCKTFLPHFHCIIYCNKSCLKCYL